MVIQNNFSMKISLVLSMPFKLTCTIFYYRVYEIPANIVIRTTWVRQLEASKKINIRMQSEKFTQNRP